jgi:spermidine synthase
MSGSINLKSNTLKLAIFATGVSGIVAEYILSTLATYFLGDSVFQWAMIVSIMLFSMGLGSRISKIFKKDLIVAFILIEFLLSVFVSYSSLLAYTAAAYTVYSGLIIYSMSILIGLMIGMEIPLVIRVNNEFEALRINISSVMENDYYGSLVGGLFFAFVGLPILGLTYTPFILGLVNFSVALVLLFFVYKDLHRGKSKFLPILAPVVALFLIAGFFVAKPIILHGEQKKYQDKVIYSEQSKYQKIVLTQWKEHYWLFINGHQQLSTVDEIMYHEPIVHPAMKLVNHPEKVLILGGGDGCAAREVLKYPSVSRITVIDLDPVMTRLAKEHPVLNQLNKHSFSDPRVDVKNQDGYTYMREMNEYFDVIIIDLPDPRTVELGRLYSVEFYKLCHRHLRPGGVLVTQAGSPYYATRAFQCINRTMESAGFNVVPMHNQVLTLGEWGWVLGQKISQDIDLKERMQALEFKDIQTDWLNNEAMMLMTSFGKDIFSPDHQLVEINKIHDPVLYHYYLKGNWDLY